MGRVTVGRGGSLHDDEERAADVVEVLEAEVRVADLAARLRGRRGGVAVEGGGAAGVVLAGAGVERELAVELPGRRVVPYLRGGGGAGGCSYVGVSDWMGRC